MPVPHVRVLEVQPEQDAEGAAEGLSRDEDGYLNDIQLQTRIWTCTQRCRVRVIHTTHITVAAIAVAVAVAVLRNRSSGKSHCIVS